MIVALLASVAFWAILLAALGLPGAAIFAGLSTLALLAAVVHG